GGGAGRGGGAGGERGRGGADPAGGGGDRGGGGCRSGAGAGDRRGGRGAARRQGGGLKAMSEERLQKVLARAGVASRRKVEELIREARVTINGKLAEIGDKADLERDAVKIDGKRGVGK